MLGAEACLSRSFPKGIGSVDLNALKIPAPEGAVYSLTVERYLSISG